MNPRPLGYEPSELPSCSTPRRCPEGYRAQVSYSKSAGLRSTYMFGRVAPVVYVVAAVVMLPVVLLVVAAVRGRAQVRSCCAADPARDLRMRAAFTDE